MAAPGENLKINPDRLWDSLMEMAKIGPGVAGGNNRQTLTDEDAEGRALFQKWCEEAGCTMGLDTMGNMFAQRDGTDPDALPVYVGSHLDTQPTPLPVQKIQVTELKFQFLRRVLKINFGIEVNPVGLQGVHPDDKTMVIKRSAPVFGVLAEMQFPVAVDTDPVVVGGACAKPPVFQIVHFIGKQIYFLFQFFRAGRITRRRR